MVRFSPRTDEARLLLPALEALRLRDIATSLWRHIRIVIVAVCRGVASRRRRAGRGVARSAG